MSRNHTTSTFSSPTKEKTHQYLIYMASILPLQPLILFLLLSYSTASPAPSLLALNCTPQPQQTLLLNNKSITFLLNNLTALVTKTYFTTLTIGTRPDRFDGLMQCRLDLSPTACRLCARMAKHTLSTLCPNAEAVAAWFDGCYVHYYNHSKFSHAVYVPVSSRSNQTYIMDRVLFEGALETLLLQLRARSSLASHLGFSNGEILYGINGSRVYALTECVRSVSPRECEVCVEEGIKKLHECCGGREGGVVVAGYCRVRFEIYRFFSHRTLYAGGSDSGGETEVISHYGGDNNGRPGVKVKVTWAWRVGAACLIGITLGAWLLRRKIANGAKVATISADCGEVGSKDMV